MRWKKGKESWTSSLSLEYFVWVIFGNGEECGGSSRVMLKSRGRYVTPHSAVGDPLAQALAGGYCCLAVAFGL
jgi:hypothetical protein